MTTDATQLPCSCACRFHEIATSLCIRKNKRLKLTVLVHDQKALSEDAHPGASFREETAELAHGIADPPRFRPLVNEGFVQETQSLTGTDIMISHGI